MTPAAKELFRKAILRVLDANRTRHGLGVVAIAHTLAMFSFTVATFGGEARVFHDAILDALDYLAGKGLVEETGKEISAEVRAWRITDKGIGFIDEQG